jgi:hypothetical protein
VTRLAGEYPVRWFCRVFDCPRAGLYRAPAVADDVANREHVADLDGVPGHHDPVDEDELDLAAVALQFLQEQDLMHVVAGQPVGVGDQDAVELGQGSEVAELVQAVSPQ